MRKISYWAKRNPWKARIIIIVSHILLLLLAWYTGSALYAFKIILPGTLFLIFILYYLSAVFIYPTKNKKKFFSQRWHYVHQKACDFSLAAAAFGMMVCVANDPEKYIPNINEALGVAVIRPNTKNEKPTAAQILESLKTRNKSTLTREEKRILRQEFKIQMKKYVVANIRGNKTDGSDAGIIILAIVAALGLAYLVGVLACNLSCNGNDGAAILVVILGTAAIGLGLYFLIRGLKRKRERGNALTPAAST